MKRKHWVSVVQALIVVAGLLFVRSMEFHVLGQSKGAETDADRTKSYLRLSDAKISDIRTKTAKFYAKQDLPDFSVKGSKAKYIARGIIVFEESDHSELDLDTQPCKAVVDVFHKPYRCTKLAQTISCNGKVLTYYEIEQLSSLSMMKSDSASSCR